MNDDALAMWTIFCKPTDYPHGYIARKLLARASGPAPTSEVLIGTLEALREHFAYLGLYRQCRAPSDPLSIVEVWF